MNDEDLFVSSSGVQHTLECALVWRGIPASMQPPVPLSRFGWTEAGKALLVRIRRNAKETGRAEGNDLPYADLRASLQARVSGLVLLDNRILQYEDESPFFAANGPTADIKTAANKAVSVWCQLTLRPWSEKLCIDCGDVDALESRAQRNELFQDKVSPSPPLEGQVPDALRSDFHDYADIILAIATPALEGAELFPGLGPVHRVVDREFGNAISFETWPSALSGGEDLFSMVAELSVETRPSSRLPFLVVRAAKRIWCREFPAPGQLFGRRRISARVLLREPGVRAINLSVGLDKGVPAVRVDSLLYQAARATGESFTEDLTELVRARGRMPGLFVGVPFRYGYRPVPRIEAGVTLQDQVDLLRAVKERISAFGFEDSKLRILESATERPKEFHQQANLHNLITHHFGRIPSDDELPQRVEELFGSVENKPRGRPRPVKTVDLEPLLLANKERLDKAFGAGVGVDLVLVCRRESEERIFRSVVSLLFGGRINVVRYALPEGVHGTKKALDGDARRSRLQRAASRKEAWADFAGQLRQEHPNSPVIVQAAREYGGLEEDGVNKDVGRNTLVTVAGCSVQYLLPPGDGKAAEYMHRVQAALYDLLYAHSGLGPVPASLVASTFAPASRPRTIVGISVVSQASSRTGRVEGAALAVAMKVDVATGRVSGRIGSLMDGRFDTGKFQALSRTLVDVASAGLTSLGEKQQDRRKNFISFVRGVVDEIASEDPNALVLLESTTSRSLWSWLSDENISSEIYLEDHAALPPSSWKSLRFVRVRERSAGRLGVQRQRNWIPVTRLGEPRQAAVVEEIYATAIERLAESLPEGNARARHYLCAHGFGIRNRGARGQSAYRQRPGFNKVGAKTPKGSKYANKVLSSPGANPPWDQPSRLPTTLEITVLPSQLGDDEDAIATLVACLRNGYSHTVDGTFLPSPLSFKSKILDYMDRYGTGRDVEDQEAGTGDEETDQSEDVDALESRAADAIGYGEIRRWFEGTSDPTEKDMPEFDDEEFRDDGATPDHAGVPRPNPVVENDANRDDLDPVPTVPSAAQDESTTMATSQSKPSSVDLDQGFPSDEAAGIEALVARLRSPSAPLPSFVTEEFLASAMHVVNSDARHMHEDREWIRTVTGFPWPEEKPATYDLPTLYVDALRYPAFAIVVQHQFFPEDNSRGLPKNQIQLRNSDFMRRLRREKPLPKSEPNLSIVRALHAADNGGDKEGLLAEVLGLPGHAAWNTKCSLASAGIDRLEAREGEWGELGRYLRAVVGPFSPLGDGQTIGEVMEEVVIPHAMRQAEGATVHAMTVPHSGESVEEPHAPEEDKIGPEEDRPLARESSLAELERAWRFHCERIETLARSAGAAGPTDGDVSEIRDSLSALLEVQDQAVKLVPAKVSTAELREALRVIAASAADALSSLIGDGLTAPQILARLFDMPGEAAAVELNSANALRVEAEASMAEADKLGADIVRIEGTLPIKQARQQTAPLIEAREQALRRSLEHAESAQNALSAATPPPASPVDGIDRKRELEEAELREAPVPASHAAAMEVVDEVLDLPVDEEPLEESASDRTDRSTRTERSRRGGRSAAGRSDRETGQPLPSRRVRTRVSPEGCRGIGRPAAWRRVFCDGVQARICRRARGRTVWSGPTVAERSPKRGD